MNKNMKLIMETWRKFEDETTELDELSLPGSSAAKMDKAVGELEQAEQAAGKLAKEPKVQSALDKLVADVVADPKILNNVLNVAKKLGITKDDNVVSATTKAFQNMSRINEDQDLEKWRDEYERQNPYGREEFHGVYDKGSEAKVTQAGKLAGGLLGVSGLASYAALFPYAISLMGVGGAVFAVWPAVAVAMVLGNVLDHVDREMPGVLTVDPRRSPEEAALGENKAK